MRRVHWKAGALLLLSLAAPMSEALNNEQPAAAAEAGQSNSSAPVTLSEWPGDGDYALGSDSKVKTSVPEGRVKAFVLKDSRVFPGFEHRWWLYIPPKHDTRKALAVMIFLDGEEFLYRDSVFRAAVVLNNLIATRELPAMAAVFINRAGLGFSDTPISGGTAVNSDSGRSSSDETTPTKPFPRLQGARSP